MCLIFFFFKQKTAYEMRISDWSSDVCSSDLPDPQEGEFLVDNALATVERGCADRPPFLRLAFILQMAIADRHAAPIPQREIEPGINRPAEQVFVGFVIFVVLAEHLRVQPRPRFRSEEHTSELQSLMRISYAVFGLKKKK